MAMQDSLLEQSVRHLIMELCEVMFHNGYSEVSVGAMMRLIGIDDQRASAHDGEMMELDADFEKALMEYRTRKTMMRGTDQGKTLH